MTIHNIGAVPGEYLDRFGPGNVTKQLSRLAGGRKLNVNLDIVPPGAASAKYHAHSLQEEFFLILGGAGTLRTAAGEQPVQTGDFIAKPAGLENPHTFINTGTKPLQILDIATVEAGDVAFYPDDEVYLLRGTGIALGSPAPEGWTSVPGE